jgi:hypothetical protein
MSFRVVVEGPDGGGKTTLIRQLVERTGLAMAERASDSAQGPIDDIGRYIDNDLLHHDREPLIYDRYPLISELVYGPTIRGYMRFNPEEILDVKWLIDRLDLFHHSFPVLIYCLPPWHCVSENVQSSKNEQMWGVKLNIRRIYEMYIALYARDAAAGLRVHHWDYTQPGNLDVIVRDIKVELG